VLVNIYQNDIACMRAMRGRSTKRVRLVRRIQHVAGADPTTRTPQRIASESGRLKKDYT
jgi:hypothetical protein